MGGTVAGDEAGSAMTDGYNEQDGPWRGRPGRATLLLGGGLAVVLLAAAGATAGWVLADPGERSTGTPAATPSEVTSPVEEPSTDRPTSGGTTTPPAPRTEDGGLTVPALVSTDFEAAREELHDRKLGWRLVFGTGTGRDVARTEPAAGTPVRRGTTVQVYVTGRAPEVTVPDLVGEECDEVAEELGEKGLYPRYRTGRRGTVTAQEPAADATAHWNDQVALICGAGEPVPTDASATP
ncbi:PASTA domain-containing protein [Micromonospora sp. DT47]|uniref:PASTA domain-containing protein n=1 Tax=Micromonospora sp. DT47 TaxID=3393431 RepID=UPI003CF018CB